MALITDSATSNAPATPVNSSGRICDQALLPLMPKLIAGFVDFKGTASPRRACSSSPNTLKRREIHDRLVPGVVWGV